MLLPLACLAAAPPPPRTDLPAQIERPSALVGVYRSREPGIRAVLRLQPDGVCRFQLSIETDNVTTSGRWSLIDDGGFACANDPGPARLQLAAPPTRDPRIALQIDARTPSGKPAEGLGLVTDSQILMIDYDGRVVIRTAEEMPDSRTVRLIRDADDQDLWSAHVAPGAPNSFVFVYHPSTEEPEHVRFAPVAGRNGVVAVELGQGGVELYRDAR